MVTLPLAQISNVIFSPTALEVVIVMTPSLPVRSASEVVDEGWEDSSACSPIEVRSVQSRTHAQWCSLLVILIGS